AAAADRPEARVRPRGAGRAADPGRRRAARAGALRAGGGGVPRQHGVRVLAWRDSGRRRPRARGAGDLGARLRGERRLGGAAARGGPRRFDAGGPGADAGSPAGMTLAGPRPYVRRRLLLLHDRAALAALAWTRVL